MKLNQVLAIEESVKKQPLADLTQAYHIAQKPDLFTGFNRTWHPRFEDGVKYPEESKIVQQNTLELIKSVTAQMSEMFNIVATKDIANCSAKADIIVDEVVLVAAVPVTYLIFLEKKLVDLRTFVSKLPVLDPSKKWSYNAQDGLYRSEPEERLKTKKTVRPIVKYDATKEHPAQTELISEDIVEGSWKETHLSGALARDTVKFMLDKISKLEQAVKVAREKANSIDVERSKIGEVVLNYLFSV
jgi:hypothetical protein